MAATSLVTELASRNKSVAAGHQPLPTIAQLGEMGKDVPHTIVLTCLDNRCQPEYFLNLQLGDGVLVMRNVGGHVAPNLNDILALDSFLGIKEIMIVHHTDCGTTHFTDNMIKETLKKRLPGYNEIDEISTFGGINDLEQSVRDDLAVLRAAPLMRKELADAASGFVYDIQTGGLTPVAA